MRGPEQAKAKLRKQVGSLDAVALNAINIYRIQILVLRFAQISIYRFLITCILPSVLQI